MAASLTASASEGVLLTAGKGRVLLNGKPVPRFSVILPGDVIETEESSAASIDGQGWGLILVPKTRVQYGDMLIVLEHGAVSVAALKGLVVRAGCISASPASNSQSERTVFEVTDTAGKVQIVAREHDVHIEEESIIAKGPKSAAKPKAATEKQVTLPEGMQTTRDEHCSERNGAPPAATNPYTQAIAGTLITGAIIYLLYPEPPPPASPSIP
jgi:hypothetical protein